MELHLIIQYQQIMPESKKPKQEIKKNDPVPNNNREQLEEVSVQNNFPPIDKPIRKVAERTQIPTDKAQLIQYLSNRIKQAQEALLDTEELLEEEVKERQKISESINQRNSQLQKLYEVDQKALPEKIKQKLTQILTETINQKLEAEDGLKMEKNQNYEFRRMYQELKLQGIFVEAKLEEQQKKQKHLNDDIESLNNLCQNHEGEIAKLTEQFEDIKGKKQDLQNKYLQMKVALERMNDLKGVLNRFFANEDLFDQKMQLKQQKIQKPPVLLKQQTRLASRQAKTTTNNPKLKPITKHDDDDFWRGDFNKHRPTF